MKRLVASLAVLVSSAASAQAPTPPAPPTPQALSSAAGHDAATQFAMGEAFRLGTGVAINRDQAIAWYRKAAAQGHVGAQNALGIMLFTKGERKTAMPLLQAAAQRGDPRALYILGTAYFNGDNVPRDYPRAYADMKRAAAAGLPEAQRNLAKMEPYLTPDDRAQAVALLAGRDLPPPAPAPLPVPVRTPAPAAAAPVTIPGVAAPMPSVMIRPPVTARKAEPRPAPAASPPASVAASGGWRAQLGAYGSATRAENQWAIYAGRVAGLAKLAHQVTQAGEVWRLQATGLADHVAADELCRKVVAAGGGCFPVRP